MSLSGSGAVCAGCCLIFCAVRAFERESSWPGLTRGPIFDMFERFAQKRRKTQSNASLASATSSRTSWPQGWPSIPKGAAQAECLKDL